MSSENPKIYLLAKLIGVLMITLLYACDVLEKDASPDWKDIQTEGSKVYTLSNSSAYIDLYSLVKTQQKVQLKIGAQPRRGVLTELGKGILQYSPDKNFVKGNDSFGFSILTLDNQLLRSDSVIIIVTSDSTQLPCGIYTQQDYVTDSVKNGSVTIDVLKNDILCDSFNIKVEVYKPLASSLPLYGTATVINRKIKYVPAANFTGEDQIIYKVTSTIDSSKFSFGQVRIAARQFSLTSDHYTYKKDTLTTRALTLYVYQNDALNFNGNSSYVANVIAAPQHGSVSVNGMVSLNYVLTNAPTVLTDSLTYKVCRGTQCKTEIGRAHV